MHVGTQLADFPREVLDAAEGGPVALLWWFGDAGVLRDLLNTECAKPRPMTDAELFESGEGAGSVAEQGRVAW